MGFVKRVFGKVYHLIVNMVCRLFVNPVGNTSFYALLPVAVNEVLALLFHNRTFFL